MKLYKFTITHTDEYHYDIEAENRDEAFDKLSKLDKEDADGHKNLDISTHLDNFGDEIIDGDKVDYEYTALKDKKAMEEDI